MDKNMSDITITSTNNDNNISESVVMPSEIVNSLNVSNVSGYDNVTIKRFGDLRPGDKVMSPSGEFVEVVRVHDRHIPKKMYHLEFDNGESIDASGNHLWYVETDMDIALHRERLKRAFEQFKKMDDSAIEHFTTLAEHSDHHKTSIDDVVDISNVFDDIDFYNEMVRIAVSIGHIEEENIIRQDLYDGEEISHTTKKIYDANLFAQQILSLQNPKKYAERWPVVRGRVIETEELVNLSETMTVNIPELHSAGEPKKSWWKKIGF